MLSIIPGAADFTAADLLKERKIRAFLHNFAGGSATGFLSLDGWAEASRSIPNNLS